MAEIFSSFLANNASLLRLFFIALFFSFIFILLTWILNHNNNFSKIETCWSPILIGLLIFLIHITIKPLATLSLNPAHDIGSKLFIYLIGWGKIAFTGQLNLFYFYVPIIGTLLGANIATLIYYYFRKQICDNKINY